jgi:hypothetical protein
MAGFISPACSKPVIEMAGFTHRFSATTSDDSAQS